MEVHHHSHTPRRKWTHYFWEFLMLFLAVFCGFLAEYQLEHKIEKDREKQYIKTFISDLQSDTGQIHTWVPMLQDVTRGIDSMMTILKSPANAGRIASIYRWSGFIEEDIQFITADRTMQQVKSSGNMRLIRKANISDSLVRYDHFIQFTNMRYSMLREARNEALDVMDELVDSRFIFANPVSDPQSYNPPSNLSLLISDPHKLDLLYNKLRRLKREIREYTRSLRYLHFLGTRLIMLLSERYSIKAG